MKKLVALLLTVFTICLLFVGCSSSLSASGCEVIKDDEGYVTYQQICDHCGYHFGDPTTAYVGTKLIYSLTCTQCGEMIYVRLVRE